MNDEAWAKMYLVFEQLGIDSRSVYVFEMICNSLIQIYLV